MIEHHLKPSAKKSRHAMPALTGIRFFAILHIFCFHLWTLYDMEKEPGFENLFQDMSGLPEGLITYFSNGWMSTSFFFLLSGFILAYIYWGPDGQLTISKKVFWLARATRIYPIHILLVSFSLLSVGYHIANGVDTFTIVASAVTTMALVQAWFPAHVPLWSWPTWTISALIFLYALMPFLMPRLAKLSRSSAVILLCMLPFISLIPTVIYSYYFPSGSEPQQFWQIFLGSTPIFWLAHFVAGMLLTRIFAISKFNDDDNKNDVRPWLAWGDVALLAVIVIGLIPGINEPFKYFLRHGLMMPLYMIIIVDLARGKGLAARFFSLRGMGFLGEAGFSIFIWQNFTMMVCWGIVMANPQIEGPQFAGVVLGTIILGIFSTYVIEQPFAKWLRRKLIK